MPVVAMHICTEAFPCIRYVHVTPGGHDAVRTYIFYIHIGTQSNVMHITVCMSMHMIPVNSLCHGKCVHVHVYSTGRLALHSSGWFSRRGSTEDPALQGCADISSLKASPPPYKLKFLKDPWSTCLNLLTHDMHPQTRDAPTFPTNQLSRNPCHRAYVCFCLILGRSAVDVMPVSQS